MRVYLACTVRGDRGGVDAGRRIHDALVARGHEVLTAHLLADDVEHAEAQVTETQVFQRDLEWLSSCDLLIAEASGSSYGVGFEVGYILGRAPVTGQKAILLYSAARRNAVSRLISGNCDPGCTTYAYSSLDDLDAFLDRALPA